MRFLNYTLGFLEDIREEHKEENVKVEDLPCRLLVMALNGVNAIELLYKDYDVIIGPHALAIGLGVLSENFVTGNRESSVREHRGDGSNGLIFADPSPNGPVEWQPVLRELTKLEVPLTVLTTPMFDGDVGLGKALEDYPLVRMGIFFPPVDEAQLERMGISPTNPQGWVLSMMMAALGRTARITSVTMPVAFAEAALHVLPKDMPLWVVPERPHVEDEIAAILRRWENDPRVRAVGSFEPLFHRGTDAFFREIAAKV